MNLMGLSLINSESGVRRQHLGYFVFPFSDFGAWWWALISRLVLIIDDDQRVKFQAPYFSFFFFFPLVASQNVVAWFPLWKFHVWRRDFQKAPSLFADTWAKCLSDCSKLFHYLPSHIIDLSWNYGQKSLYTTLKYRSLDLDEISQRPMLSLFYIKLILLSRESGT